ncbi:MAG: PAS domain-containing protein, partial [Povalibacter sp.]
MSDIGEIVAAETVAMLDAIAHPIVVIDGCSSLRTIAYVNPAFVKLTGYDSASVVGQELKALAAQSDLSSLKALWEAVETGAPYSGEITLQSADARAVLTRISVKPVHGSDRQLSHLVVTLEDLTRYSKLRESLRTSEPRLQVAMDASQLSMWDWDVEQDRVSYNEHWRISLGFDPSDLVKREELPERLLLPADQLNVLEQFEQHFNGLTQCFECEYSLRTSFGETRWFAARAQVVKRDSHGKAQRMIGVLRDISRKKRDLELASGIQAQWERAIRGTSDGLYDWDLLTGHVWYAARFSEIIGHAGSTFPETFNAFQNVLHPDDRQMVLQKIRKHLENQVSLDVRCRVVGHGGRLIWCRMRGEAERDAAGRPLRLAGSISDVSAQIAAEEALGRSQNFYGTILDSLPFYVAYVNREENVVYANRQFQEFFCLPLSNHRGRPVKEVLGRRRYKAIGPHFREALLGRMVESQGR